QAEIYDQFAQKLQQAISQLRIGNGVEPDVDIGPLINQAAVEKVEQLVADAVARGARVVIGGARTKAHSAVYLPTLLIEVPSDAALCEEEIFGPVAALIKFDTEQEAIALANASEYGLAGYFYTQNPSRIWRVAEQLECGMVAINDGVLSNEMAPFGGIKQSGMGREGSRYGLDDYLNIKYLCQGSLE